MNLTTWRPDTYSKNARFVSDLGEPQLLDPPPGKTIMISAATTARSLKRLPPQEAR